MGDDHKNHRFGVALALLGTVTVTPDALMVRYAEAAGAGPGLLICLKNVLTGAFSLVAALVLYRCRVRSICVGIRAAAPHLALVAIVQTLVNVGFPMAFLFTGAARALLLVALNPLWAALLGWGCLKERPALPTFVCLGLALVSILVVFVPPMILSDAGSGEGTLGGDLIALATGAALASYLTACRWAARERPGCPLFFSAPLSMLIGALCSLPFATTEATGRAALAEPVFWGVMTADGFCLTVAFACVVHAPQYTSSTQVALILLLENLLGPLWVYLGFGEVPSVWTFVGGGMLICTLAAHEVWLVARTTKSYRLRASVWAGHPPKYSTGTTSLEEGTTTAEHESHVRA